MMMRLLLWLGIALYATSSHGSAIEVAITLDDIPASGIELPGRSRTADFEQIIATLKKHQVHQAYGFLSGIMVKDMAERLTLLKGWRDAGHLLGNHTYNHKDLSRVAAAEFIADIEANEPLLIDYAQSIEEAKVLRFPFLSEGEDQPKRYAVRSYLAKRKYRTAQVTIDFDDWAWNPAYIRCSQKKEAKTVADLEASYVDLAVKRLKLFDDLARRLYGNRKVKHILLLHMTPMTSHMLDPLLAAYEKAGAVFIPASEAIRDSIFDEDTVFTEKDGKTFLIQAQESRKLKWPGLVIPQIPREKLAHFCL